MDEKDEEQRRLLNAENEDEALKYFMDLVKNISTDGMSSRINVRTITKINDLTNLQIKSIEINSPSLENLEQIKSLISSPGETNVFLNISNKKVAHQYKLNEKRKIDQKTISQLKSAGVTLKIH